MRNSYDTKALEEWVFGSGREEEGVAEGEGATEEEGAAEEREVREPADTGTWEPSDMDVPEFPDTEDPVTMTVTLENGTQREYMVAGVFLEGKKEYIALETEEGDIHIMELSEGEEDEVRLLPVEEKEEQERAIEAFHYYFENSAPGMENQREREKKDDRDQDREED